MWRCINYKHNSSQIKLFSLSDCSVCLVSGVGVKLSRPVYLSKCEDLSFKHNWIQTQLLSLLYFLYAWQQGGGKLSRAVYLAPTCISKVNPSLFNWNIVDGTQRIKSNKTKVKFWMLNILFQTLKNENVIFVFIVQVEWFPLSHNLIDGL